MPALAQEAACRDQLTSPFSAEEEVVSVRRGARDVVRCQPQPVGGATRQPRQRVRARRAAHPHRLRWPRAFTGPLQGVACDTHGLEHNNIGP